MSNKKYEYITINMIEDNPSFMNPLKETHTKIFKLLNGYFKKNKVEIMSIKYDYTFKKVRIELLLEDRK